MHHRLVEIAGSVHIVDYDLLDENDIDTFPFFDQCIVDPFNRKQSFSWEQCVDEVRIRIDVECNLALDHQSVSVKTRARMYEGATCLTDELDGDVQYEFVVAPGQTVPIPIEKVGNTGDRGDLTLTVTNLQQP